MNDVKQPVTQASDSLQTRAQPPQPTAAPQTPSGVEREPIARPMVAAPEAPVQASAEIAISQELKDVGVENSKQHEPILPPEVKQAGVTVSAPVQPVSVEPSLQIKLPMSYSEAVAQEKLKQNKFSDGIKWLAAEVAYQWRKLNPKLYK